MALRCVAVCYSVLQRIAGIVGWRLITSHVTNNRYVILQFSNVIMLLSSHHPCVQILITWCDILMQAIWREPVAHLCVCGGICERET